MTIDLLNLIRTDREREADIIIGLLISILWDVRLKGGGKGFMCGCGVSVLKLSLIHI